ncbi:phosphatase PAP2 family protein [Streptococcus dentapri]|uniref:Phosphatase PAP2 family protein n=1 Tax=Streptococcus dentapri TaxID=573564 RepID=A0ABV8CYM9_9STRE
MKNKQVYLLRASFTVLIFVLLGYIVKFYPDVIEGFDRSVQSAIRGNLPDPLTSFFKTITILGNPVVQILLIALLFVLFLWKKWYAEAGFIVSSGAVAGLFILTLKNLYQRPRPELSQLVEAHGYSFPSGHSLCLMMIFGSLIIIAHQRIQAQNSRRLVETVLGLLILLVGFSRIYLGVHYPTDVLAGFVLGYGMINLIYPFYNQKRFEWRFQSKQR